GARGASRIAEESTRPRGGARPRRRLHEADLEGVSDLGRADGNRGLMPANERTVRSDGVELAVREAGDPSRPIVVLVHGYPDTSALWQPVFERLEPRYHVVTYDVRGAGASSTPR